MELYGNSASSEIGKEVWIRRHQFLRGSFVVDGSEIEDITVK